MNVHIMDNNTEVGEINKNYDELINEMTRYPDDKLNKILSDLFRDIENDDAINKLMTSSETTLGNIIHELVKDM